MAKHALIRQKIWIEYVDIFPVRSSFLLEYSMYMYNMSEQFSRILIR